MALDAPYGLSSSKARRDQPVQGVPFARQKVFARLCHVEFLAALKALSAQQLRGRKTVMDPVVEYVEHVDVWAATIEDKPGALAYALAELREAGADLQFIIARRAEPGKGVVFVTPLRGDREIAAAAQVGFNVTRTLHSVRIMGQDRPGVAAEVTQKLADGGINLRGFSLSVIGRQYLAYAAVDSLSDANKVIEILKA